MIRVVALEQLRRVGASALSLREVARAAGLSPAGMYRYVDGRDGLLELLISDGFESFGASIEVAIAAAGDDTLDRLEAVGLGYRRWALANPEQFGLILGTPIPGFSARSDGPTVSSVARFAAPMIEVVASAYAATHPGEAWEGSATNDHSRLTTGRSAVAGPPAEVLVRCWSRIHGLVALEAFGHLDWSGTDVEVLLRTELHSIATEIGLADVVASRRRGS